MAADTQRRWHHATVVEAGDVAAGVRRVVLEPDRPTPARPGAHVDLLLPLAGGLETRSYSVVESLDGGRRLALSVQLAPASRGGSRHLHGLAVGDRVEVTHPLQNFPLGVGAAHHVLVAGGIGVTALVAMAATLQRRGASYELVYVGRSRAVMAYVEELRAAHGDRLHLHVDDEGTSLDVDALLDEVAQGELAARTEMYVCGPIRLMDALRRSWAAHGLSGPSLRFETFGNSGAWAAEDFVVRIPRLGAEVAVGADSSMLAALESAGVQVMSDCRKGECGLCTVRVLDVEGHVDHRDVFLDVDQQERGTTMCCCVSRVALGAAPDLAAARPAVLTIDLP